MIVTVLWEDAFAPAANVFPPHELLCAGIADVRQQARWEVENLVQARPMNGSDKVLRKLIADERKLRAGGPTFAIFDSDQSHRLAQGPKQDCIVRKAEQLRTSIRTQLPGTSQEELSRRVYLLDRNMEELLDAVGKVVHLPPPPKKKPDERDTFLRSSGILRPDASELRSKLYELQPSFGLLVTRVAAVLAPSAPSPASATRRTTCT